MGIRVRIRINIKGKSIDTSALVSSGFEAPEPTICIPTSLARTLGLWPSQRLVAEEAMTAGGEVTVHEVPERAIVQLLANSEVLSEARCLVIVNPIIDEVLLSDMAIDELGIVPISFGKGLWRHKTDNVSIVRRSAEPEYWP
ncbi:MAG: hypothetical protein DRN15_05375 [Thermoprotei archaeon]|nr:MAG: hypothetical protein DRM97_08680 [Thermoprotei archaeon]RLF23746.1 MAG: hypothetical protein DRN15_05375 [Thermoprotei archaeon]